MTHFLSPPSGHDNSTLFSFSPSLCLFTFPHNPLFSPSLLQLPSYLSFSFAQSFRISFIPSLIICSTLSPAFFASLSFSLHLSLYHSINICPVAVSIHLSASIIVSQSIFLDLSALICLPIRLNVKSILPAPLSVKRLL